MRTKFYLLLIALVTTIGSVWGQGQTFTYGGLNYRVTDVAGRTVEVARGNYSGDIVIPSTVPFGNDTYKVESIVDYAFYRTQGLRSVVLSEGLKSIGVSAFSNDSSLVSVTFNNVTTLETIADHAFRSCVALTEITIPEGVQNIGENSFLGCLGLTIVNLPSTLATIGTNAFFGCENVKSFNMESANTNYISTGGVLYNGAMTMIIAYPNGSEETSFAIPHGVTTLDPRMFAWATNLTDFVDNSHPTFSIIDGAVFNNTEKTLIYCPPGKAGEYEIPAGVETLSERAFMGSKLTKILFPASVATINMSDMFSYCTELAEFEVADGNGHFKSEAGVIFSKDMTRLVAYPPVRLGDDYEVPNGVTTIGALAFRGSSSVKNIKLPNGITTISGSAFFLAESLESINLPSSITSFGNSSFATCYGLKAITLPDNMTSIPLGFLRYSTSLTSIEIPQGVTSIGYQAFQYSGLESVILPDNLLTIDYNAFDGTNLTSIVIPANVTSIGANAFDSNSKLKEVTFLAADPTAIIVDTDAFFGIAEDAYMVVPQGSKALYEAWVDANSLPFVVYEAATVVVNPATGVKFIDDETGEVLSELPQAATGKEYTILPEDDEKYEVESVTVNGSPITKGTDGEFHIFLDGDKAIDVVIVPKKVVTFINDGVTIHTQYVKNGALATSYSSVSKSGHNLRGWNVGSSTTLYDFSTPVTADLTLTASWTEILAEYTVTITPLSGVRVNRTGDTVNAGGSFKFEAEAIASGNTLSVSVNGSPLSAISGTTYLIEDIREDKTVRFTLTRGGTTPTPDPEVGPGLPGGPGQVIIDKDTPSDIPGVHPPTGEIIVYPPIVEPGTDPSVTLDGEEVEGEWKTDDNGNPIYVIDFDDLEDGEHTLVIGDKEYTFTTDKNAGGATSNDILSTTKIVAGHGSISVSVAQPTHVQIVSMTGAVVYSANVASETVVSLPQGLYIVKAGTSGVKVVVR